MSYYTDYIIECDQLAFNRILNEWKEKRGECETELPIPDYVWENIKKESSERQEDVDNEQRYMMYFCVNHGPYSVDVLNWLFVNLGLDERHFLLRVKSENDDVWRNHGTMNSNGGYKDLEYDEETGKEIMESVPDGWSKYEYCCITIDPRIWKLADVDYTSDCVKTRNVTEELLQEIVSRLDEIEETLVDLQECITNR